MAITTADAVREKLGEIDGEIRLAVRSAEGDGGASPVLRAVVAEFGRKSVKALAALDGAATSATVRDCVIELEQAGDSAKAAVEADPAASETTRRAVLDAHTVICVYKFEMLGG